jgi:hypothetical protein
MMSKSKVGLKSMGNSVRENWKHMWLVSSFSQFTVKGLNYGLKSIAPYSLSFSVSLFLSLSPFYLSHLSLLNFSIALTLPK